MWHNEYGQVAWTDEARIDREGRRLIRQVNQMRMVIDVSQASEWAVQHVFRFVFAVYDALL